MTPIAKGRYVARLAESRADLRAAMDLRQITFRTGNAAGQTAVLDADRFDNLCCHVLIEAADSGKLVCCFRVLSLSSGAGIVGSYAAQFYELSALQNFTAPMAEIGRFCIDPGCQDPDILRLAWAVLTRMVDGEGVGMLFGCSSFRGIDAAPHAEALSLLAYRHLAPQRWRPGIKASQVVRFAEAPRSRKPDQAAAVLAMPPLLRTYLAMGGWVSDHAVVDRDLNTLHVFTGLEIRTIPASRARLLRAMAQ